MSLGTEISCVDDLDPLFTLVSGRTALIQALARRYITTRGSLVEDEEYGYNLRDKLGESVTPGELAEIESEVVDEALKDERVARATATVRFDEPAQRIDLTIAAVDGFGPFQRVLAITDLTLEDIQGP